MEKKAANYTALYNIKILIGCLRSVLEIADGAGGVSMKLENNFKTVCKIYNTSSTLCPTFR